MIIGCLCALNFNSVNSSVVVLFENPVERYQTQKQTPLGLCFSPPSPAETATRIKRQILKVKTSQIVSLSVVISGRFCFLSDCIKYL